MERRIPELDGLRALAIGMVVLWHYVGISDPGNLYVIFRLGRSGVDLFFVLSGFLITSILIANRDSPTYYKTFYLRRAARIMPAYFALLAAFFAVRAGGGDPRLIGGEEFNLWTYPVFLHNVEMTRLGAYGPDFLGHTWSLAVEEQFYAVFPLLVALVPVRRLPLVLLALACAAPVLRIAAYLWAGYFPAYVLTPMRADSLAMGGLIAWVMLNWPAWLVTHRTKIRNVFLFMTALIPMIWLIPRHSGEWHMAVWGHSYYTLLYGAALLWVLCNPGAAWLSPLRTAFAVGLGAISYALYLVHWPMFRGVFAVFEASPNIRGFEGLALSSLALILSLAVAIACYFLIEQPFIRLGRRLHYAVQPGPQIG